MMTMVIIMITIKVTMNEDSPPDRPSSTRVKKSPLGLSLASLNHLLSIGDLINMNMMKMVEIKIIIKHASLHHHLHPGPPGHEW